MRLTYILAVVIAATLQASGTALATTKHSNHASISNVASADIVQTLDATQENSGRMLRKVKEDEEERSFIQNLKYMKTSVGKRLPWTRSHKIYKTAEKLQWNANKMKRIESNINYGFEK